MKKQLLSLAVASLVCAGVAEARIYIGVEGGYTGGAYDAKDHKTQTNSSYLLFPGGGTFGNSFKDKTYSVTYNDGTNGDKPGTKKVEPWKGYNIALTLGSEHFFASNYLGVRWGASVGYTQIMQDYTYTTQLIQSSYTDTLGFLDTGLSFDLIANIISGSSFTFGVFGGVETDYHYLVEAEREHMGKTSSRLSDIGRHSLDFSGRLGVSSLIGNHHRIDLTAKLPIAYVAAGCNNKVKINGDMPVRTSFNVGYKYVF